MEKQPELFTEFKEGQAEKKVFTKSFIPDRTFVIAFTYEKLILAVLGLLVSLAVVFAFGFEYGKGRGAVRRIAVVQPKLVQPQPVTVQQVPPRVETPRQVAKQPVALAKQAAPAKTAPVKAKPYTIQVATFRSRDLAQQEVTLLKQKGFGAQAVNMNGFYEVWVGEFTDSKDASLILGKLRKLYKDCFLKKK